MERCFVSGTSDVKSLRSVIKCAAKISRFDDTMIAKSNTTRIVGRRCSTRLVPSCVRLLSQDEAYDAEEPGVTRLLPRSHYPHYLFANQL